MKFDNKIFILLTTITIFFSCSIDKRLYRSGFYIDNSIIFENKRYTIDNPVDNSQKLDNSSFQPNEPDDLIASNSKTSKIILKKKTIYRDSSLQKLIIIATKDKNILYKVNNASDTVVKTNPTFSSKSVIPKNNCDNDTPWDKIKEVLLLLAWIIGELGVMFLIGFGLHALFPNLSLFIVYPLGVLIFFLIWLIVALIFGVH